MCSSAFFRNCSDQELLRLDYETAAEIELIKRLERIYNNALIAAADGVEFKLLDFLTEKG